jgi:hypothetical protein
MDEGLRRLQRQRSDPESRARYARELLRSGTIDDCVNHICDIGEHFNYVEALGSSKDISYAITQRRELLSKIAGCLAPVKIYILMRMTDEGDPQPIGAFTTRDAALREAAERAMDGIGNWYHDVDEGTDEHALLGDLQYLYNHEDYQGIIDQTRYHGLYFPITESELYG